LINTINDKNRLAALVSELKKHNTLGVDTEFIRERTFYPEIALIQIATKDQAWLIDPTAFGSAELSSLFGLLRDDKILKIMHASQGDQECFHLCHGFVVAPVLDTAVAAALCGLGDNVGLGKLLKVMLGVTLAKGRARARWLERPLPLPLQEYALQDVLHLVRLGEALTEKLREKGRYEWALEESATSMDEFDVSPEKMAEQLGRGGRLNESRLFVLSELLKWREERARRANLPRRWVADNETLMALAQVRPKTLDELRSFRGLNLKEVERSGPKILAAIAKTPKGSEKVISLVRSHIPSETEERVLELMRTFVSFLSVRYAIAPRFLVSPKRALGLVQHAELAPEEWVAKGYLSKEASQLIGRDLKDFFLGKKVLGIVKGRVEIIAV